MAITTVDVVRNTVSGVEVIHNGNIVAGCLRTGVYAIPASGTTINDNTKTYSDLETRLTSKFDSSVSYYNKAPV